MTLRAMETPTTTMTTTMTTPLRTTTTAELPRPISSASSYSNDEERAADAAPLNSAGAASATSAAAASATSTAAASATSAAAASATPAAAVQSRRQSSERAVKGDSSKMWESPSSISARPSGFTIVTNDDDDNIDDDDDNDDDDDDDDESDVGAKSWGQRKIVLRSKRSADHREKDDFYS